MELIILLLIAYLLGSIPSALWVGKLFYKMDIREHGSGNLGGTNTFRVLGKKAGLNRNNSRYFKRDGGDNVTISSNFREYQQLSAYSGIACSCGPYVSSFRPI